MLWEGFYERRASSGFPSHGWATESVFVKFCERGYDCRCLKIAEVAPLDPSLDSLDSKEVTPLESRAQAATMAAARLDEQSSADTGSMTTVVPGDRSGTFGSGGSSFSDSEAIFGGPGGCCGPGGTGSGGAL